MNNFDINIINYLNSFARNSHFFDLAINSWVNNNFIKTIIPIMILWWAWFKVTDYQNRNRLIIISTFIATFFGLFLARGLTFILPFRFRPIHNNQLDFILPFGTDVKVLDGWSSLPSDHAVIMFTLVTGIFYISKKLGIFLSIYLLITVLIPRIYLGLHYPTDILVGIIIGIIMTIIFNKDFCYNRLSRPILDLSITKPEYFYPVFFLISYQSSDLFEGFRHISHMIHEALEIILI